jgi:UDP-N-acetylmuramyl tripeptide synthase
VRSIQPETRPRIRDEDRVGVAVRAGGVSAIGGPSAVVPWPGRGRGWWTRVAVRAGITAGQISRRWGLGAGGIIGGRVTLVLAPSALSRLARGRRVVLVSGTNGKTTTSHMLAAAMRTAGAVAHNASGANMADGAVAALAADRDAPVAVLEVDELHLAAVAAAVDPAVVVLLNLSRDQLDRGSEVRAVAASLAAALSAHPEAVVVANADDPMVVWAAARCARTVWVSTGHRWSGDATNCPRCGHILHRHTDSDGERWACRCGLARPVPRWVATDAAAVTRDGVVPVRLRLPGRFNLGNAVTAMAAASVLGVDPQRAAASMSELPDVAGRYAVVVHGDHELRLLLAKNPAGWAETLGLLDDARPLLVIVNSREADGCDTSWLWDVSFEDLVHRQVVAAGERAADLGVRLTYAGVEHTTVADPLAGLALLPPGPVDVVANYTAFHQLRRRLTASATSQKSAQ